MHRSIVLLPTLLPPAGDPSEREAVLAARRPDAPPLPPGARPTLRERLARLVALARLRPSRGAPADELRAVRRPARHIG